MKNLPSFAAIFLTMLGFDLIAILVVPFFPSFLWVALYWMLFLLPIASAACLPHALTWMKTKYDISKRSALAKYQLGGGLWFLLWMATYCYLHKLGESMEIWQLYIYVVCYLQIFRCVWFGFFNVASLVTMPFLAKRQDKLCLSASALTSSVALYLWQVSSDLPSFPEINSENLPYLIFYALGSLAYGLLAGAFLQYVFSSVVEASKDLS